MSKLDEAQTYPAHTLLHQCCQRLRRKPSLQRRPDKDNLAAGTGQKRRAHIVFACISQWPAANLRNGTPLGDVTGAGAHWGAQTIVEKFLHGKVDVEIGLLAQRVGRRDIIIALHRRSSV